jgi:hypothetical protein
MAPPWRLAELAYDVIDVEIYTIYYNVLLMNYNEVPKGILLLLNRSSVLNQCQSSYIYIYMFRLYCYWIYMQSENWISFKRHRILLHIYIYILKSAEYCNASLCNFWWRIKVQAKYWTSSKNNWEFKSLIHSIYILD